MLGFGQYLQCIGFSDDILPKQLMIPHVTIVAAIAVWFGSASISG